MNRLSIVACFISVVLILAAGVVGGRSILIKLRAERLQSFQIIHEIKALQDQVGTLHRLTAGQTNAIMATLDASSNKVAEVGGRVDEIRNQVAGVGGKVGEISDQIAAVRDQLSPLDFLSRKAGEMYSNQVLEQYAYSQKSVPTVSGLPMPFGGTDPRTYKTETSCGGDQPDKTMVLVPIGQSNAANYAGKMTRSAFGVKVLNYYDGRCFLGEDPLLGGDGNSGSLWVDLANQIIEAGIYDRVIIAPFAVGGSPIARWRKGGDFNPPLNAMLSQLVEKGLSPSHVIWVQGEAERFAPEFRLDAQAYETPLREVIATIRDKTKAAIYISLASSCPNQRDQLGPVSAIRKAQSDVVSSKDRIFRGADLDAINGFGDRFDACHLTGAGIKKANADFLQAIAKSF